MRISKIVLSGANEYVDAGTLANFCNRDLSAQIGIQVSGDKASFGSARYWWIWTLCWYANYNTDIALHLNKDWVEDFCAGKIPPELELFLNFKHQNGSPIISEIQLNFKIGREKTPNIDTLLSVMKHYWRHKFILSYNDSNKEFIHKIYQSGFKIDSLLYDSSFGEGITPSTRLAPVYDDVHQGYAGGFSPENVEEELNKIDAIVPPDKSFFIDAEGKLKGEDGHLSLEKCKVFLEKAYKWDLHKFIGK